MFVPIVQIPMTKRPRDAAVEAARKSAPRYYLNGEAAAAGIISGRAGSASKVKTSPPLRGRRAGEVSASYADGGVMS